MNSVESLQLLVNEENIQVAEKTLGAQLRTYESANAALLTPDEAAKELCDSIPAYTEGNFVGFTPVISKDPTNEENRSLFYQRLTIMNGRILLMPTLRGEVLRTLVHLEGDVVSLAALGVFAKEQLTPAEQTVFSALRTFYDPSAGKHSNQEVRTEPGHVVYTSRAVLGAVAAGTTVTSESIHHSVHTFEDVTGNDGNILLASTSSSDILGVPSYSSQYTYETWPQKIQLLYKAAFCDRSGAPAAANVQGAVEQVQAAAFVTLRMQELDKAAMTVLGEMK